MKCYKNKKIISGHVDIADTSMKRLVGLLNKKSLSPQASLLITPCSQIHTCFMRFSIDCIFLNHENTVVHIIETMRPWKISKHISLSHKVLEMPAGTVSRMDISIGDCLIFKE